MLMRNLLVNSHTTDSPFAAKSAESRFRLVPRTAACALFRVLACNLHRLLIAAMLILAGARFGHAWMQAPDPSAAVEELYAQAIAAKRSGDLDGAIERYRAILKLDPRLAAAHNNLGLLYFQKSNYPAAVKAFEEGLRIDGKMITALVPLGTAYFHMGQLAQSRAVLEKAVRLNPTDEQAQLYLARSMFSLGQQEAGAAVLQKLLQKSPANVEALYTLGQMYMKLAQRTLKRLEEQAPDSYLTNLISGQLLESMENYDEALAQYKKALAKQPDFKGAHYNPGNIYWLEGKWAEAIAEMKQELTIDRHNCLVYWKIGNSLVNTKEDPGAALDNVQQALAICPDLAQAHLDLGRLLAEKGDFQKAAASYRRVIELSPEEPSVHFLLSTAYRKMGMINEANAEARIVQEMSKKAQRARESRLGTTP